MMKSVFACIIFFGITMLVVIGSAIPTDLSKDLVPRSNIISDVDVIDIVAREPQAIGKVIKKIADLIGDIVSGIKKEIAEDKLKREAFTQSVVDRGCAQKPQFNWIICHVKHKTHFDGKRGVDWDHSHQELDVKFGGTIGYEIYWLRSGKFTRKGDGGYMNWAMCGNFKRSGKQGKVVTFTKRKK